MIEPQRQTPPSPPGPPAPARLREAEARGQAVLRAQAAPLADLLAGLRRRAAARQVLAGLVEAGAVAGLALALAVVLVALRQTWARPVGWTLAGAGLLVALGAGLWRARKLARDDAAAARALGRAHPERASDLLSAVELARGLEAGEWSEPLARAHIARMGRLAPALTVKPRLPWKRLAIAAGALVVAMVAHAAMRRAGGRFDDAWAYLLFRAAPDAPLFAPDPIAGDIVLVYKYPDHMQRPPRTVPGTGGDISAPKGTVVELSARADRDTPRAFATLGKLRVPLRVQGRQLTGALLVTEAGEWRLRYETEKGRVLAEGPPRPVVIEPDSFPEVKLLAPVAEKEVNPGEVVTLEWTAGDDYGLLGLDLLYTLARGGTETRKGVATWKDVPRRQRGELRWDLTPLGLQPGDRVTYYLEAKDNDTVSGPKTAVSGSQVLRVFSQSEHNREVLAKAEEQWERLLTGLADRLEEPPPAEPAQKLDDAWHQRTTKQDQNLATVALDMQKLAAELAQDERAPKEIGRALGAVGQRVGGAVAKTTTFRRGLKEVRSGNMVRSFRGVLSQEIVEDEQGVLYLEDLLDRRKLLDLREMARELERGRRELASLVEKFKQAPDEQTRRQINGEVARLKERLHELYRRMQELAKGIQDEHLNEDAMKRLDEGRDLLSQLDEVQRRLARGETDEALKALEELQKGLAEMEKQFGESAGEADEESKEITRQLQKLASDLMDVEADQRAVKKETDALRAKSADEMAKKLEKQGRDFVQRQRERVAKARKELEGVNPELSQGLGFEEDQQALLERLAQLDEALKTGDLEEARNLAREAAQHGGDIRQRLEMERDAARRYPGFTREPQQLEAGADRATRAEKPVREVRDDLEKLMQSLREPPSEAEREQMKELAKRQAGVRRGTEQLQQGFEEVGKKMPLFGQGPGRLLREASQDMEEARGKLGEEDPRGASGRQADALEKLQKLKESMQQSQQEGGGGEGIPMPFGPMGGEEGGEPGDGRGVRMEKVEIPSADQSRAPEEFRKDILDAMKDETPENYRDRVRDYYEELVR